MRHQHNPPVDTFIFEDGPEPMAVEHVGGSQDTLQVLCAGCNNHADTDISELAEVLALLFEVTDQGQLAREMRYRILPSIKEP